ncbi:MAG: DUF2635 domain-containing protein [Microbispora sp.]|nr:DUF2635 domain-containing protein [Microbispora sp.]
MYVKPAPGLAVRDPDLRDFLPPEGREVPENTYWAARLRDGDVLAAEPPTGEETP